jgi:predicted alpha/beta superfamily hydrolase
MRCPPVHSSQQWLLCVVSLLTGGVAMPQAGGQPTPPPCVGTVVGELRIESFKSVTYGDERTLRVWLPPGYNEAGNLESRFPTLYMFDGQTLFDRCTAFSGERELEVDETVTRLIADGTLPQMIVVGVDSSSRRTHEYRPYRDTVVEPASPEPGGKDLPGFVVNEVIRYVSERYRVTSDPAATGIGGTSAGAIAALYVLLNRSDRFGIGLIESATLPLGNGQLLRDTAFLARGPDRIYIGAGSSELAGVAGEKFAAQLRTTLLSANEGFARMNETLAAHLKGAYLNRPDVTLVIDPQGTHTSAAWARRFPTAVAALYGPRRRQ